MAFVLHLFMVVPFRAAHLPDNGHLRAAVHKRRHIVAVDLQVYVQHIHLDKHLRGDIPRVRIQTRFMTLGIS